MAVPLTLHPYDPGWAERYQAESAALERALGHSTEGGVLDDIAHIGSTSIPDLSAIACIDVIARVYPFPLMDEKLQAVTDLGYEDLGEHGLPGRHYFRKGPNDVHLHVVSFESEHWPRHLVFREYLRANAAARHRYEASKRDLAGRYLPPPSPEDLQAYRQGRAPLIDLLEQEAFAWHVETTGFRPVSDVVQELEGLSCPWFVSSGWALDLFSGAPSRYHEDLDIVLARDDQLALQQHLLARGWRLHEVVDGKYTLWRAGERIATSTLQVHARKEEKFIDLLFEPREGGDWVYRRNRDIRMPLAEVEMRFKGIPYVAPEIVLLFKSRSSLSPDGGPREKDAADFERALPMLGADRAAWLRQALLSTASPVHPWCERLRIYSGSDSEKGG